MFERFTEGAREAESRAIGEAGDLGHEHVDPTHLLLGLAGGGDAAAKALTESGAHPDSVRGCLKETFGEGEAGLSNVTFTMRTKRVLELASAAASEAGDRSVDTHHLLMSLTSGVGGEVEDVMDGLGIDRRVLRKRLVSLMGLDKDTEEAIVRGLVLPEEAEAPWLDPDKPTPPPDEQRRLLETWEKSK